jgi:hypothetical protein
MTKSLSVCFSPSLKGQFGYPSAEINGEKKLTIPDGDLPEHEHPQQL